MMAIGLVLLIIAAGGVVAALSVAMTFHQRLSMLGLSAVIAICAAFYLAAAS